MSVHCAVHDRECGVNKCVSVLYRNGCGVNTKVFTSVQDGGEVYI